MNYALARVNNTIVFAQAPVEQHLDRYREAGFLVSDHIADWDPGLRNGFIELWPEYLEILTVADENVFADEAPAQLKSERARGGIHALEFYSHDTRGVHAALTGAGNHLPDVCEARLASTPADSPPDFLFLELPHLLQGTSTITMTSMYPDAAMRRLVQVAPNGVFGLAGLTILDEDPDAAARRWSDLTEPGVHDIEFLSSQEWRTRWPEATQSAGVVCVHLLSEDVSRTVTAMTAAGWEAAGTPTIPGRVDLLPHPADGMRFTVRSGGPHTWIRRRLEVLGEHLELRER